MTSVLQSQHEHYAEVRRRLTSGQEPPERARRYLLPPVPKPEPFCIPEAVRRKVKVPTVIHARRGGIEPVVEAVSQPEELLPLPGAEKWKAIISEVCEKYGIDWVELASHRRSGDVVVARHEAMFRMRHETTMSLPAIGRKLGGRDHTTVLYGISRHQERMEAGK